MPKRKRQWYTFRVTVYDIGKVGEAPSRAEYHDTVRALSKADAELAIRRVMAQMVGNGTPLPEWCTDYCLVAVTETREEVAA